MNAISLYDYSFCPEANLNILEKFEKLTHFLLYRLQQNRKSAQKCRLKKKAEFYTMKEDVMKFQ